MRKNATLLLALAFLSAVLFSMVSWGTAIQNGVNIGDEFEYEVKYAENPYLDIIPAEIRNDNITAMIKIRIVDIDTTSIQAGAGMAGVISEKIWYMEVGSRWQVWDEKRDFTIAINANPPHNIKTFGIVPFIDGAVLNTTVKSFIEDAPIYIPTGLTDTYWNSITQLFSGQLTYAYSAQSAITVVRSGSTFTVNQLQTIGIYSTYRISMTYGSDGVLENFRVETTQNVNHIIFSLQRLTPEFSLQPSINDYPTWLYYIAIGAIFAIIIFALWLKQRSIHDYSESMGTGFHLFKFGTPSDRTEGGSARSRTTMSRDGNMGKWEAGMLYVELYPGILVSFIMIAYVIDATGANSTDTISASLLFLLAAVPIMVVVGAILAMKKHVLFHLIPALMGAIYLIIFMTTDDSVKYFIFGPGTDFLIGGIIGCIAGFLKK